MQINGWTLITAALTAYNYSLKTHSTLWPINYRVTVSSVLHSPSDICKSFQAAVQSFEAQPPAGSCWWVEEAGRSRSGRSWLMFQDVSFLPAWVPQAVGKREIWKMEKFIESLSDMRRTLVNKYDVMKGKRWCHELIRQVRGRFSYFLDLDHLGAGRRWQWRRLVLSFLHHLLDQRSGASWLSNRHVVTHFFNINPPQRFLWITWSASVMMSYWFRIILIRTPQSDGNRMQMFNPCVMHSATCWAKEVTTCVRRY